ncbi:hypothetical protein C8035_v006314 [Colletotrichum spinosum]|uniref:Uncharacterized protein n=1 Tax=Colletotrichum spinosum TaxID=1347390 RepID=A0A4R8QT79_9PEZI|nr:hypothetical protein C8035_v006314 [Colletotrichum spinosum]
MQGTATVTADWVQKQDANQPVFAGRSDFDAIWGNVHDGASVVEQASSGLLSSSVSEVRLIAAQLAQLRRDLEGLKTTVELIEAVKEDCKSYRRSQQTLIVAHGKALVTASRRHRELCGHMHNLDVAISTARVSHLDILESFEGAKRRIVGWCLLCSIVMATLMFCLR